MYLRSEAWRIAEALMSDRRQQVVGGRFRLGRVSGWE